MLMLHRDTGRSRRRIGPEDHGRLMTLEEFQAAKEAEGFVYELIDGVLIVSPVPKPAHDHWVQLLESHLEQYGRRCPALINYVSTHCEVVVPIRPGPTRPQPDIAAFRAFPKPPPPEWDSVCPVLVVEIISPRRERKDTTRNRQLYWSVGGILEYWIIDAQDDPPRPLLIILTRHPGATGWEERRLPYGQTYRSTMFPRLTVNLKRLEKHSS